MKICKKGLHSYPKERRYCPECCSIKAKAWRKANAERNKVLIDTWREANKEHFKSVSKICVERWHKANPERKKENLKNWQKANPDKCTFHSVKYQATKLKRTPLWLSQGQLKEIEAYYILVKELQWLSEEPLEVDHIVPLQGKNVSGLHVPWNLQILPRPLNRSKSNRLLP